MDRVRLLRRAAFYARQLLLPSIPKILSRTLATFSSPCSQKSIISGQPDETFVPRIYTKSDRIYNICSEDDETDLRLKMLQYSEGEEDSDSSSSDSPTYFKIGDIHSESPEFDWLREISKLAPEDILSPDSLFESELVPEDSEMVHVDPTTSSEAEAELVHEDSVENDNSDSNWKDNFREYRPSGYNLFQTDLRLKMLQYSEGEEDRDNGSSDSPTYFDKIGDIRSDSSEFDWLREISKLVPDDIFYEKSSSHMSPDSLSESELVP